MGISSKEQFELKARLRQMVRDLKILQKSIEQAKFEVDSSQNKALSLISEAKACEMIPKQKIVDEKTLIDNLREVLKWTPASLPDDDSHRITEIEIELQQHRKERVDLQKRVDAAERYAKEANGFAREVEEQKDRLKSIKALPKNTITGEWQWPFSEKT